MPQNSKFLSVYQWYDLFRRVTMATTTPTPQYHRGQMCQSTSQLTWVKVHQVRVHRVIGHSRRWGLTQQPNLCWCPAWRHSLARTCDVMTMTWRHTDYLVCCQAETCR